MMKVAIVTDTNSGISPAFAKELGISIVPMPFLINDEEFFEDVNLNQEQFYQKLLSGANVSTSQPNIYDVMEIWENLLKENDEIVYIPMSSGLSNSCETAINFAKQFDGRVQVVDNKRISVTQKQSVIDAVNMAKDGMNALQIKEALMQSSMNASIYIMVSTLTYLKKGGRITPAAAAIGTLLKIKPVLTIQGAKLDKCGQVMTLSQAKRKMLEQMTKDIDTRFADLIKQGKFKLFMAYTYDKDKCLEFKKEAEEVFSKYNLKIEFVDPLSLSVSCHIGPGAIAIAGCEFYK
ncbi:MAG: DegV family protein [Clostridia bacterium]|nr:DegV family protein [Clostridia bacterium]